MKIEIDLKVCMYCKFFQFETADGNDFLDEPFCKKTKEVVSNGNKCESFKIDKESLKVIKQDFKPCKIKTIKQ